MADILANHSAAKIVPRILFDGWHGEPLKRLLTDPGEQDACARFVAGFLEVFIRKRIKIKMYKNKNKS
jgi:hypothetical protein